MKKIKTVRAVHHGTNFIVEVEIILSGSMPLAIAHDVGEELQRQLQKVSNVERAFVHLDFEITHVPAFEDIIVWYIRIYDFNQYYLNKIKTRWVELFLTGSSVILFFMTSALHKKVYEVY